MNWQDWTLLIVFVISIFLLGARYGFGLGRKYQMNLPALTNCSQPITEARGVRKLIILIYLLFAFSPIGAVIDSIWWRFVGRARYEQLYVQPYRLS